MRQSILALLLLLGMIDTATVAAQKLSVETYHVKVVTKTGGRSRGILQDVTATTLYCGPNPLYDPDDDALISLETIRKITLRRTSKRRAIQAGAVVGAITVGLLTVEGLKNSPTSNGLTYGTTVLFSAGAGAAVGLLAGSVVGNLAHRVIRPRETENGLNDFRRQLEPFSVRYQQDVFNRVHQ